MALLSDRINYPKTVQKSIVTGLFGCGRGANGWTQGVLTGRGYRRVPTVGKNAGGRICCRAT